MAKVKKNLRKIKHNLMYTKVVICGKIILDLVGKIQKLYHKTDTLSADFLERRVGEEHGVQKTYH